MNEIQNFNEIPNFKNEHEEAEFWSTHELGSELLELMEQDGSEIAPAAKEFYENALERFRKGDYEGAMEQFTQALFVKPNYDEAYIARGIARSNLGDKQGAVEDYTIAIEINPNNADAYVSHKLS